MEEIKEEPLDKPIGHFIIDEAPFIAMEDGAYYHYSDVCSILKKYRTHLIEETKKEFDRLTNKEQ